MAQLKPLLRDLPPASLADLARNRGLPAWRAGQLSDWLFRFGVLDFDQMTNLPAALRNQFRQDFDLRAMTPCDRVVSKDGTRKFLFELRDGHLIESVLIPMADKATFCLSSQVGCAMACSFCATARGGLARQLSSAEILEQVFHLREDLAREPVDGHGDRGFNLVFMGMGEPLDNFDHVAAAIEMLVSEKGLAMSPRRITISTSGHEAGLRRLLTFGPKVGLTLSLGSPIPEVRRKLMPVAGRTKLETTLDLVQQYSRRIERPCTVVCVMIEGQNDSPAEARGLADLLAGRPMKVNLIPLNAIDPDGQVPSRSQTLLAFQEVLRNAGIQTNIRHSGGQDIDAACGQLRRRKQKTEPPCPGDTGAPESSRPNN